MSDMICPECQEVACDDLCPDPRSKTKELTAFDEMIEMLEKFDKVMLYSEPLSEGNYMTFKSKDFVEVIKKTFLESSGEY